MKLWCGRTARTPPGSSHPTTPRTHTRTHAPPHTGRTARSATSNLTRTAASFGGCATTSLWRIASVGKSGRPTARGWWSGWRRRRRRETMASMGESIRQPPQTQHKASRGPRRRRWSDKRQDKSASHPIPLLYPWTFEVAITACGAHTWRPNLPSPPPPVLASTHKDTHTRVHTHTPQPEHMTQASGLSREQAMAAAWNSASAASFCSSSRACWSTVNLMASTAGRVRK